MAMHRAHSIKFKQQVVQEYLGGETLHSLSKRHDISRNLIRVWVQKYEAGEYDEDAVTADLVQAYEARIAALERLVGKQALELEFLKGAQKSSARPRSGTALSEQLFEDAKELIDRCQLAYELCHSARAVSRFCLKTRLG